MSNLPQAGAPQTRNIKLVIAYDGARYHGWQRQTEDLPTVQGCLEAAAERLLGHPVATLGAARTDAGVHAAGQVASFLTSSPGIPTPNLRRALNSALPPDIAVVSAEEAPADFHASRSAVAKTYRYRLYRRPLKPVMQAGQVYHYWRELNAERMADAASRLLGEHDFRGFAPAVERRPDTIRTLTRCDVAENGDELHVTVTGNRFLYRMVRNVMGTLIEIGRGRWSPGQVDKVLQSRDRSHAGPTAPAHGLCLLCVEYPPRDDTSGQ